MSKNGKFEFREFKEFNDKIQKLSEEQVIEDFIEECAKEIATRLLAKVIQRTPTGQYPSGLGKVGGTLKRGWTIGEIRHEGNNYIVEVMNPVEYASYVEYGHKQEPGRYVPTIGKRLKKAWVEGKFMLTISEQEIQSATPKILENKIVKMLGECFK